MYCAGRGGAGGAEDLVLLFSDTAARRIRESDAFFADVCFSAEGAVLIEQLAAPESFTV